MLAVQGLLRQILIAYLDLQILLLFPTLSLTMVRARLRALGLTHLIHPPTLPFHPRPCSAEHIVNTNRPFLQQHHHHHLESRFHARRPFLPLRGGREVNPKMDLDQK